MEKVNPGNVVVVSIGGYFIASAMKDVIEQNGCLVIPQSDSDKTAE